MISSKTMMIPAVVLLCASSGAMAADPAAPTTESTGALPGFTQVDVDQNGGISKTEAAQVPALAEQFAQVDSNADGWISMQEYTALGAGSSRRNEAGS